jgi:hypothetical protein
MYCAAVAQGDGLAAVAVQVGSAETRNIRLKIECEDERDAGIDAKG